MESPREYVCMTIHMYVRIYTRMHEKNGINGSCIWALNRMIIW